MLATEDAHIPHGGGGPAGFVHCGPVAVANRHDSPSPLWKAHNPQPRRVTGSRPLAKGAERRLLLGRRPRVVEARLEQRAQHGARPLVPPEQREAKLCQLERVHGSAPRRGALHQKVHPNRGHCLGAHRAQPPQPRGHEGVDVPLGVGHRRVVAAEPVSDGVGAHLRGGARAS
eukprot:1212021-Prymnesium_polylepis.1